MTTRRRKRSMPEEVEPKEKVTRPARNRRSRVRNLDTGKQAAARPEMPDNIKELATVVFSENKKMNSAKNAHDKARKSLSGELNDLKVAGENTDFNFGTLIESKRVEIEVGLVEGSTTTIDMAKLKTLVDEVTWEKLLSTTKTAIVNAAGATIADQCCKTKKTGVFTSKVKAAK